MKIAVLGESPEDEAAIKILVDGVLGYETQLVDLPPLRTRGWTVINLLPAIIKKLHYQTDAEALVVVWDSDDSPVHQSSHDEASGEGARCRLCQTRSVINLEKSRLRAVPGRSVIKTAVGLAVPAIEAWYRCGLDPHVSEATWIRKLQYGEAGIYTRKSLKNDVYGNDRPSSPIKTLYANQSASRLVRDLTLLEQLFPNGFGPFARDLRSWLS
ncbi:MAG: hypothetical protein H0T92_05620 [Pyrinomonadaceae bacterium]|jgi:hypothetical protein|nr:hypothetical protein [Pyrinomonadaceae bacterium]